MKTNPKLEKNVFFDINKLPPEKGLLLFGLSMNKLDHGRQTAKDCLEDIRHFSPSKVSKPFIGTNFIYSDFLNLYSDKQAPKIKDSLMDQVIRHKNSLQRLLEKNNIELQIQHSFNWLVLVFTPARCTRFRRPRSCSNRAGYFCKSNCSATPRKRRSSLAVYIPVVRKTQGTRKPAQSRNIFVWSRRIGFANLGDSPHRKIGTGHRDNSRGLYRFRD